jgi:hypothetical protein
MKRSLRFSAVCRVCRKRRRPLAGPPISGGWEGNVELNPRPIIAWKIETVKKKVKYFFPQSLQRLLLVLNAIKDVYERN